MTSEKISHLRLSYYLSPDTLLSMTTTKDKTAEYGRRISYIDREFGSLKGKTIALIRPLTEDECKQFAWEYDYNDNAMALFFTDGTVVVPSCDPEGNGAGFLFVIPSGEDK